MSARERKAALVILAGAVVLFLLRPSARTYTNRDVARYAQMAFEMRHERELGHEKPLIPRWHDKPYHEAMPIAAWFPYVVADAEGVVEPLCGRLPNAIAALLLVGATLVLAAWHTTGRAALLATGAVALNYLTVIHGRDSRIDLLWALGTAGAVAAYFQGCERGRWRWFWVSGFWLAVAISAKGPAAAAVVIAALGPYVVVRGGWKRAVLGGALAAAFALALSVAWFYPYAQYLGPAELKAFIDQFWGKETIEKLETGYEKTHAPGYYVLRMTWHFAPWILAFWPAFGRALLGGVGVLAARLGRPIRLKRDAAGEAAGDPAAQARAWIATALETPPTPLATLATSWVLGPLLTFEVAAGKQMRYMLPLLPGFALLAAWQVERWLADDAPPTARRATLGFVRVASILAAAFGVLAPIGIALHGRALDLAGRVGPLGIVVLDSDRALVLEPYGLLLGLATAVAGGVALVLLGRRRTFEALLALFVSGATASGLFYAAILPLPVAERTSSPYYVLVEELAPVLAANAAPLTVEDDRPADDGDTIDNGSLGLQLGRWVDRARRGEAKAASVLLARTEIAGRPVLARFTWHARSVQRAEPWVLLGPAR